MISDMFVGVIFEINRVECNFKTEGNSVISTIFRGCQCNFFFNFLSFFLFPHMIFW